MKLDFKKLLVPFSNNTREVDVVQMWEVRWRSRNGEYGSDTRPELECFTSQKEAEDFAGSIINAFKLIRAYERNEGVHKEVEVNYEGK